jgi:hypothetical protein
MCERCQPQWLMGVLALVLVFVLKEDKAATKSANTEDGSQDAFDSLKMD